MENALRISTRSWLPAPTLPRPSIPASLLALATALALSAPDRALGQQDSDAAQDYLRAVSEHFRIPAAEVAALSRWGLPAGDIPVVLFLSGQAGVSPDVVVAQRRRGAEWMEIARGYSVHAGSFHVPLDGPPGFLAGAYERFGSVDALAWSSISLSDAEVAGLVNVRLLSQHMGMPPARVLAELGSGDVVAGYRRLRGGGR